MKRYILWFFLIIAIIELSLRLVEGGQAYTLYSKPLLMPILAWYVWQSRARHSKRSLYPILGALGFSWLGDVCLMFDTYHALFFALGLASFLVAHLLYTWRYLSDAPININTSGWSLGFGFGLILYGSIIYQLILPNLGSLRYPVLAYIAVIMLMGFTAFNRQQRGRYTGAGLVTLGAILFIISDSLIALNNFYHDIALADFGIMLTYIMAQYFIIIGLNKDNTVPKSA